MLERTDGHDTWQVATHYDTAYLCGRRKRQFIQAPRSDRSVIESAMLESDADLSLDRITEVVQRTQGRWCALVLSDSRKPAPSHCGCTA